MVMLAYIHIIRMVLKMLWAEGMTNIILLTFIDFDNGYVYYFCNGYGSEKGAHETCYRLKIDSGTLTDVLIITYHDGSHV